MGKGKRNRQNRETAETTLAEFLKANPACNKAIKAEINRQLQKAHEQFFEAELAVILWVLHEAFGFGHDRCLRFMSLYKKLAKAVTEFYEADYDVPDSAYFFKHRVKTVLGIDVTKEFTSEV